MLNESRVKSKAKLKGISMRSLSVALGKQEYFLYGVFQGKTHATSVEIERLAELLDTTPAYLEGETDSPDIVRNTEEFVDIYRLVNNRPSTKLLFSALKNATDEDIKQTIAILEALKRTNGQQ